MKEIILKLDYSHGPIWKDRFDAATGRWTTGIECIDKDKALQVLNDEAEQIYSSLYSFGEDGEACTFDEDKYEEIKDQLRSLVQTIIMRLEKLQDGSFYVKDEVTSQLKAYRKAS